MELYHLLPGIIRELDRRASSITGIGEGEGFWEKVFYAIETDTQDTETLISGLSSLFDAASCPQNILPHLAAFLGSIPSSLWEEDRKRLFLKDIILLYKIGGTVACWGALLRLLGFSSSYVDQLWKTNVNEGFDYYGDEAIGTYRAARVDLYAAGILIGPETFSEIHRLIFDKFRPIHVRVRQTVVMATKEDLSDQIPTSLISPAAGLGIAEYPEFAEDDGIIVTVTCISTAETGYYADGGLFTGDVVTIGAGGESLLLSIVNGVFYSGDPGVVHTGTISITEPATGDSATLAITGGVVYSGYSGLIAVTDPVTGGAVVLSINGGLAHTS